MTHRYLLKSSNMNITLETVFNQLGSMQAIQTDNHNEISNKLDGIQHNFDSVNGVVADHSNQLKSLDYDKRRKNLIIYGIPEDQNDLEKVVVSLFHTHMKLNDFSLFELDFCRRLGKQPNQNKPRPIIVGLTTQRRKIDILKNSVLLKGTAVYVKQDLSPESRVAHKKLREERDALRREGKNAVIRSGRLICSNEGSGGNFSTEVANTSSARNKRASSESPSNVPETQKSALKKVNNAGDSEVMNLQNNTLIQSQQQQDTGFEHLMEFGTPTQPPRRQTSEARNLLQPSILPFINSQQESSSKNK